MKGQFFLPKNFLMLTKRLLSREKPAAESADTFREYGTWTAIERSWVSVDLMSEVRIRTGQENRAVTIIYAESLVFVEGSRSNFTPSHFFSQTM
jgi:hypothetical protein